MPSEEEQLIDAVKNESVLYDTKHTCYMKVRLKNAIWESIAQALHYKDGDSAKDAWLKLRNCHRDAMRRQKKLRARGFEIKIWKYQRQMEFLIPFMANAEIIWSDDNEYEMNNDNESQSDENGFMESTVAEGDNVPECILNLPDEDSTVEPRERKKRKTADIRNIETVYVDQCLVKQEQERPIARRNVEEKPLNEARDPLYNFFMTMYATTAKMPPASQHMVKKEVFRVVSDAEESLLYS